MREIKFRVWDKKNNKMFDDITGEFINEIETTVNQTLDFVKRSGMVEVMQFTGLLDKNGKEIYEGDIVEFEYLEELHQSVKLKGIFVFNEDELRYEIDVLNNEDYTCLSYTGNGTFFGFKIMGNKFENPELLK